MLTWVWKGHFLSETWESAGTQKTLLSAKLRAPHDARLQIFLSWDVITGSLRRDPPMAGRKAEEDDFKRDLKGFVQCSMYSHQDMRRNQRLFWLSHCGGLRIKKKMDKLKFVFIVSSSW